MTRSSAPPVRQTPLLLVVEDSNEDFEALQRFLQRSPIAITIQRCVNGEQALAFLYGIGSYTDILHQCICINWSLDYDGKDRRVGKQ